MKTIPKLLLSLALLAGITTALDAAPSTCQVFCVSSPCQRDSQCNEAPGGTCNLVCPKNGCCVYP